MSQCLNPNCLYQNPSGTAFCQRCGSKILLGDRYRPVRFLGAGGFGRTFQAVDEQRLYVCGTDFLHHLPGKRHFTSCKGNKTSLYLGCKR
jgi:DNA-directed RNA polymerase subunit RPC12/RpoP